MDFREKDYKVFEMFDKEWALVTGGGDEDFNSCTVSWGSLGNIWGPSGKSRYTVTVFIHPARFTSEFLKDSEYFTVSFYPKEYKKALSFMGSHSGRDGDKVEASGLTPVDFGESLTFEEANLTFLCKKLYQHQILEKDLAPEIIEYYEKYPKVYPDGKGGSMPHIMFIGEIVDVLDKR